MVYHHIRKREEGKCYLKDFADYLVTLESLKNIVSLDNTVLCTSSFGSSSAKSIVLFFHPAMLKKKKLLFV